MTNGDDRTRPDLSGDALRRAVGEESTDARAPSVAAPGGRTSSGGAPAGRVPSAGASGSRPGWWTWAPWAAMAVIVVVALAVGATRDEGPTTNAERVYDVARTIACPECSGQSVAESDISVSREIRRDIAARIEAGQTDDQIRAYYADRFGEEVLLTPSASGATGLVWVLPVVAAVAALAGLVLVFLRWRSRPARAASDADRALVDAALRGGTGSSVGGADGPSGDAGPPEGGVAEAPR